MNNRCMNREEEEDWKFYLAAVDGDGDGEENETRVWDWASDFMLSSYFCPTYINGLYGLTCMGWANHQNNTNVTLLAPLFTPRPPKYHFCPWT